GQQRRVHWTKSRTLGERDEEIINEAGPPMRAGELAALIMRDLHLREEKTGAAEFLLLVAHGRSPAIEPPIPKGKDNYVREPEQAAGEQEFQRRLPMRRKRADQ